MLLQYGPRFLSTLLVKFGTLARIFCKNLGHLREFFGQMVYRPPLAKNFPYAYGHWRHVLNLQSLLSSAS